MNFKSGWFFSPETESGGVNSESELTPVESSGVAGAMPTGTTKDASNSTPNYEVLLKQREADLNKMKSTFQRQIAELQHQQEEERKRYEQKLREIQMANLSDDERKEYEQTLKLEEAERYRQEAEQYRQQIEEIQLMNNYTSFFVEMGVPQSTLSMESLDDLVQSGWMGIQQIIQNLRSELNKLKADNSQHTEKSNVSANQQRVMTSTSGVPSTGVTWDDLIKKYGSMEAVFNKVERGELPPSVIPLR